MKCHRLATFHWSLLLLVIGSRTPCARADEAALDRFEAKIRPVLVRHCYACHAHASPEAKGGLKLDTRAGIRRGGDSGAAVVPGAPEKSLLLAAMRHEHLEMPPDQKLPADVIRDFQQWIAEGAVDPREHPPNAEAIRQATWQATFATRKRWWSLQPLQVTSLADFPTGPATQSLDRFVLRQLQTQQLAFARQANRRTLARRLYYTLHGLPPDPDVVDRFVQDPKPTAYEDLVDRLLASPHFGEHLARRWMDVVRYTDTYGYEWDIPAKGAWRYRDYLTRAFNGDVSYGQLVREQIAGDLLTSPRVNRVDQINESQIGLMFYQMGEKRHGDSSEFNGIHQEMLDNKIDALSKTFQATTVACARCHDHKLDAVSQSEYYALAGALMSSRWITNTVDLPERNATRIALLEQTKRELRAQLARQWRQDATHFSNHLQALAADKLADLAKGPEHPLYVWSKLLGAADKQPLAKAWTEIATEYQKLAAERTAENQAHFRTIADFRDGIPHGWHVDGSGIRQTPTGDLAIALEGESIITRVLRGGITTHSLSPRLNGVLRTPYLGQFGNAHISFEHTGGDFAAHRTVIDNAFLTEKQRYLNAPQPQWTRLSTFGHQTDRRNYIEFATKTSNPNFPPRVGLGGAVTAEQIQSPQSWFGITRVVIHQAPHSPKDELQRFLPLFRDAPPASRQAAGQRIAAWFNAAVQAWADETCDEDDVRLLNWLLAQKWLSNRPQSQALKTRLQQYRDLERTLQIPWTVNGMLDHDPGHDVRLNIRGDYDQLGKPIPRGYLSVLCTDGQRPGFEAQGSGRRELAERIATADNPLTARVYVNRVWQWMFGSGLVTTPNDFGHLGEPPTHPALLDHFARHFIDSDWSTKWLVRQLVTSRTWRQAGQVGDRAHTRDPKNRLWHHFPTQRLPAEAIRDAMLVASTRFDRRLYGPPIDPHRTNEDPQKRLMSGPVDGLGRRSLYTKVTIMEPARFLATFNQPDPKIPTGKRDVTNTPAQALTLLNDPFVTDQAKCWATQLVTQPHTSPAQRLHVMFRAAFGREITPAELTTWLTAIDQFPTANSTPTQNVMDNLDLWTSLAHILFNTKEFIYIR